MINHIGECVGKHSGRPPTYWEGEGSRVERERKERESVLTVSKKVDGRREPGPKEDSVERTKLPIITKLTNRKTNSIPSFSF